MPPLACLPLPLLLPLPLSHPPLLPLLPTCPTCPTCLFCHPSLLPPRLLPYTPHPTPYTLVKSLPLLPLLPRLPLSSGH